MSFASIPSSSSPICESKSRIFCANLPVNFCIVLKVTSSSDFSSPSVSIGSSSISPSSGNGISVGSDDGADGAGIGAGAGAGGTGAGAGAGAGAGGACSSISSPTGSSVFFKPDVVFR